MVLKSTVEPFSLPEIVVGLKTLILDHCRFKRCCGPDRMVLTFAGCGRL